MTLIHVTLVPLSEGPEKSMGPEWRREGPAEQLRPNQGIILHAEADREEDLRGKLEMDLKAHTEKDRSIEILEPVAVVTDATLRITATKIMLGLFAFSVVATFAIILGYGIGYLRYPDWFLKWLGVVTIGEIATFLGYILKYLFPQTIKNKRRK